MAGDSAETSLRAQNPSPSTVDDSSIFSTRSKRQLTTFAVGATLCIASAWYTKRTFAHRIAAMRPKYFEPSNNPPLPINAAKLAGEAFGVATMNVWSWAIMLGGGTLWAFDIGSMEEFRTRTRQSLGWDEKEQAAHRQEQDMEDRISRILERREAEGRASK